MATMTFSTVSIPPRGTSGNVRGEGGKEEGREGGKEEGREGGKEEGREGRRKEGGEGRRKEGREGRRKEGGEGRREGEGEGGGMGGGKEVEHGGGELHHLLIAEYYRSCDEDEHCASICVQDLESIAACEHASNFAAAYVMYEHGLRLGREAPGPKSLQKQVPIHCRPVATAEVGCCADEGSRAPYCGTRTPVIGFINAYEEAVLAIALMRPVDHPIVALEPQ